MTDNNTMKCFNNFNEMYNSNNNTKQDMSVFNVSLEDVKNLVYKDFLKTKKTVIYDDLEEDWDRFEGMDLNDIVKTAIEEPSPIYAQTLKDSVDENVDDYFSVLYDETVPRRNDGYLLGTTGLPYLLFWKVIDKNSLNEDIQLLSELGIDLNAKWREEEQEQYKATLLDESFWSDTEMKVYGDFYEQFNGDTDKANKAYLEEFRDIWERPSVDYIQRTTYSYLLDYLYNTYSKEMKNKVYDDLYKELSRYNEII
jgi:hypothetical protein